MRPIGDPPVGWPEFDYTLPPEDKVAEPPYHPPRLFTGHPTLDGMLSVWHGAVTPAGPPRWEDLADKIWHPWSTSLLLVEIRGPKKPVQSVEAFPVASGLLGLPLFFRGDLPMDNPHAAEVAELARQVAETRRMIPRILPAMAASGGGKAFQPLAIGVPLAPLARSLWRGPIQRVLLSVAPPAKRRGVGAHGCPDKASLID